MKFNVENLEEKNMVKLVIEASDEEFANGRKRAYVKNRSKITVNGFRKGKATQEVIEKMYGKEVFYEDGANEIVGELYEKAAKESGLDIVSAPKIGLVSLEYGKPFVFYAEVAVKPEVTLGDYKGIEFEKVDTEVSDEELAEEIDKVRAQNSRRVSVTDRPVADGDIAIIDFEGFVDGKAFEGGKGTNHELKIGSHSFIDTFEEQLIGKNAGDETEVNVTFPENYHSEDLKGKAAMFKVKINEIKYDELPELNDEFASEVSDFDTLAEYKEDLKKELKQKKEMAAYNEVEEKVIAKVVENASMDVPSAMIDTQVRSMADDFANRLRMQGITIEQYFQFTGLTQESLFADLRPQAEKQVKSRLVLEAVVKAENITVSEEELEEELKDIADKYKMPVEKVKEIIVGEERESLKRDIEVKKASELIVEAAKEI